MQLNPKTFRFLSQLKKNNNREWFEKHRDEYETLNENWNEFVGALIKSLSQKDKRLIGLEPKQCVFRIYRDVRFSKDKTPYKAHFSAVIAKGGRKSPLPGFYVHIESGENWVGGGMWRPEAPLLKKVRQEIDYNWKEYKKIVSTKSFKDTFEEYEDKMTLLPKGYSKDNPAAEVLKNKSFVYGTSFSDKEVMSLNFIKDLQKTYVAMLPFYNFLYRATE